MIRLILGMETKIMMFSNKSVFNTWEFSTIKHIYVWYRHIYIDKIKIHTHKERTRNKMYSLFFYLFTCPRVENSCIIDASWDFLNWSSTCYEETDKVMLTHERLLQ